MKSEDITTMIISRMSFPGLDVIAGFAYVLCLLNPGFAAQPAAASLYEDIGDEESAWINDLLDWRGNVAEWKHQVQRRCFVNESDAYWSLLFECPDFSDIECVNQTAWNSMKDPLNCTIAFCEDGLYTNNTVLRMINRDQAHMHKRIIAIYKEDLIQCKQRECPESRTKTSLATYHSTTSGSSTTTMTPDIDECKHGLDNCDVNAECINNDGSFNCSCKTGYTGTGKTCTDIDECSASLDNCDENANCRNNDGSFTCSCKIGYTGNGNRCTDIDECKPGLDNCDVNAECINNDGSFSCSCKTGYAGNGRTCTDINECSVGSDNCNENANCSNNAGSFTCSCKIGYTGNGRNCTDIDECSAGSHNCVTNANCSNNNGSFNCSCKSGYYGGGIECTDIDECKHGLDNCDVNAECNNNDGSFNCSCKSGYTGNGRTCTDIDECSAGSDNCGENANCSNNNGSFTCSCKIGYTGNRTKCTDIDECSTGSHNCDINANCSNNDGSFDCSCKSGYNGSGTECTDIDECSAKLDNCDVNAECINNDGSFTCSCITGYTGTGVTCTDIDECLAGSHDCDRNADCINNDGSFDCPCKTGYRSSGTECVDIDECLAGSHNCDVNADCSNNDGSFICTCKTGYEGTGAECTDCRQAIFDFPETDHLDYVQYNGFLPRLESFTTCVWIEPVSGGHTVKGQILSYCTEGAPYCNTMRMGIHNNKIQLSVPVGNSYTDFYASVPQIKEKTHMCIVFSNTKANLRLYLNGIEPVQPFSTTAAIPPGGVLILGQDQDNGIIGSSPGNPKQATEGFYGKMRGLLLWDRDFSENEIADMYRSGCSCTNGAVVSFDSSNSLIKGNVVANWEQSCDEA